VERPAALLERDKTLDRGALMGGKLRIAMMLESDGPGGAEMMMFRLSEELRGRGHVVVPVGPANGIGWLGDLFRQAGVSPEYFRLRRPVDPGCVQDLMRLHDGCVWRRRMPVARAPAHHHDARWLQGMYGDAQARRTSVGDEELRSYGDGVARDTTTIRLRAWRSRGALHRGAKRRARASRRCRTCAG